MKTGNALGRTDPRLEANRYEDKRRSGADAGQLLAHVAIRPVSLA